ncbi:phage tail fiber-like protein [Aeromonas encheleia]|uniref:phage tail-collar fiber domain-containing protein n=1 Tax=Aeromonas encheleia TaxID=73010 RepID=UPI0005B2248F|nr:phage tail protein [Aeromonas encheleia]VEG97049.1 phage tail fiber-like protein [Aeromonas encheleia]
MSQIITNAFSRYWQECLATQVPVVLDEFVLANVPDLDPEAPINPDGSLPDAGQIVHRHTVDQRGRINNDAVAYTIVMDTTVGDFSFNAMYLINRASGVVGMIVHKGLETKLKTNEATGQTGNSLVKSMLMEYDRASEATATHVDASTWQIDYAARLRGMDDDLRLQALQFFGPATFYGNGFNLVNASGVYKVQPGVAYVGGLRAELNEVKKVTPGAKPVGLWLDIYRAGSLLDAWVNHFTLSLSVPELTDYLDANGYQHHVAKVAIVNADGSVTDVRRKRTIELTGDVTGKGILEDAQGVTIAVEIKDGSHRHQWGDLDAVPETATRWPTKHEISLEQVNNWPATSELTDTSDNKYATAGAVAKTHARASATYPVVRVSGSNAPALSAYAKLCEMDSNIGENANLYSAMVSGGANYGSPYSPNYLVTLSSRGYVGIGPLPDYLANVTFLGPGAQPDDVGFLIRRQGERIELWLKLAPYSYPVSIQVINVVSADPTVSPAQAAYPDGATPVRINAVYTTASKPTPSEVGAVPYRRLSEWTGSGIEGAVIGQLAWRNYGNNHTIFDASNSIAPDGSRAVNPLNSELTWGASQPTLMGWNGQNTYGVRVDSARVVDPHNHTAAQGNQDLVAGGWGQVGTYVFARNLSPTDIGISGTIPGSSLRPANPSNTYDGIQDVALPGTWKAMGYSHVGGGDDTRVTLWFRIA